MTTIRRIAYLALALAYAQIVFGAVVRITDSGLGCGTHWPKCNGMWFPPLDNTELIIEITHRWIAAGLLVATLALVATAFVRRHEPGVGGRGGVLRMGSAAAALWLAPAILGGVTVWLELPPSVVVVHMTLALALLAVLAIAVVRAGGFGAARLMRESVAPLAPPAAIATVGLTFIVVLMGGFTANVAGAAPACQGFPLCNGSVIADGTAQTIHWTHRLVAYLLTLHVTGLTIAAYKRNNVTMRRAMTVLASLVATQIVIAAVLVSTFLPPMLQSAHQAVGTLVWLTVVIVAALAWRGSKYPARLPSDGSTRSAAPASAGRGAPAS